MIRLPEREIYRITAMALSRPKKRAGKGLMGKGEG
jgi:hypothetical protein